MTNKSRSEAIESLKSGEMRSNPWGSFEDTYDTGAIVAPRAKVFEDSLLSHQKEEKKAKVNFFASWWNWLYPSKEVVPVETETALKIESVKPSSPIRPPHSIDQTEFQQGLDELFKMVKQLRDMPFDEIEDMEKETGIRLVKQKDSYELGTLNNYALFRRKKDENGGPSAKLKAANREMDEVHEKAIWWRTVNHYAMVASAAVTAAVGLFVLSAGIGIATITASLTAAGKIATASLGILNAGTSILKTFFDRQFNIAQGNVKIENHQYKKSTLKLNGFIEKSTVDYGHLVDVLTALRRLGDKKFEAGKDILSNKAAPAA